MPKRSPWSRFKSVFGKKPQPQPDVVPEIDEELEVDDLDVADDVLDLGENELEDGGSPEPLLTFDQLALSMGQRPKGDKLGGLWKRSKRYKAVEGALQEVNDIVGESTVADINGDEEARAALVEKLEALAEKARSYLRGHTSQKDRQKLKAEAMTALLKRTQHALAVVADPDVDTLPDAVTLSQAIQMKVCGVLFKDVDFVSFEDEHIDHDSSEEEFGSGNANTVAKLVYDDGMTVRTLIFKPEPVTDTNPLLAQGKMGIDLQAPHYGERNIASQKLDALLGGHTVVKSRLILHDGELGLLMDKADGKMPGERARIPVSPQQQTYIDTVVANNQPLERALKLLKAMEFVATEGANEGDLVWLKVEPRYADPFEGAPPDDTLKASIQQQLCGLEWADALAGQFDRHGENYLISFDRVTGTCAVTGIDNDLAFGQETTEIPSPGPDPMTGYNGVGLPVLIDRTTHDRLDALDFDRDVLPELTGRLKDAEVRATRARFDALQRHARALAAGHCVVDNWQTWRSPEGQTATEFLDGQDTANSYYKRDIHEHTT